MQGENKIVALVGMAGSGKSTVAEFFKRKGIPVLRFGDQTDIGVKEMGLPLTEANERMYREKLRNELGMAAYSIKIEPRIRKQLETDSFIVLDGLYSWEEYKYLIGQFPSMIILCVYAPPKVRYDRLSKRTVRPLTQEESMSRDYAEIENLHKAGPIAMADYIISNTSDEQSLQEQLEKLVLIL